MKHYRYDDEQHELHRNARPSPAPGEPYRPFREPRTPIQIEEDVPIPEHMRPKHARPQKYPFVTMQVGDTMMIPPNVVNKPYFDAIRAAEKAKGMRFTRTPLPDGIRVERVRVPKPVSRRPFDHMAVGDSVVLPLKEDRGRYMQWIRNTTYYKGGVFDAEEWRAGLRVWRIR